jgi:acyl dehydratase
MPARELSSPPSMTALYPRAVGGAVLPLVRKLPGVGGGSHELPGEELLLRDAEIDSKRLAAYCRVCTLQIRDVVPATYPHLLAFPLAMRLMTDPAFPFPAIGLVHIQNRIAQLRPIRADERLELRVRTADLRAHDRGRQFDVVAEARAGGDAVWRGSSTYLHRGGGGAGSSQDGKQHPKPPKPDAKLRVPGDIGRRYGAVSGDRNPIHLHPLSARLFGMPRPIAHGMWLKARCLALLEAELPDEFAAEVSFKLPVYLPGTLSFASWREDGGKRFALHDGDNEKPHLSGSVSLD